jgi:hypothetical protein
MFTLHIHSRRHFENKYPAELLSSYDTFIDIATLTGLRRVNNILISSVSNIAHNTLATHIWNAWVQDAVTNMSLRANPNLTLFSLFSLGQEIT